MQPDSYNVVAAEYYDPSRHPTCANFREASLLLTKEWLHEVGTHTGIYCDVGCGNSVLAEALIGQHTEVPLILVDGSLDMLRYSSQWSGNLSYLTVASAYRLPLPTNSVSTLLCSLGDPFNSPSLWEELFRVLTLGGRALFTTPSFEWASAFRSQQSARTSEFLLTNGAHVELPSVIYPRGVQADMIQRAGLKVASIRDVSVSQLNGQLSAKILIGSSAMPVVTAFSIRK